MKYYKIEIDVPENFDANLLNIALNLDGVIDDYWTYEIEEADNAEYIDWIEIFYNALSPNKEKLANLGIDKDDITIWYLYEYDQQCNTEFSPEDLAKLGELGITFCISCWEK